MSEAEPILEATGLTRVYRHGRVRVPALQGVSLRVLRGEVACVVGPSGSGKTTLLNVIGGLDRPTEGGILVDGLDLTALSPGQLADYRLRKVGFVFQFYNLIPILTALENVELPMALAGVPEHERRERAFDLLEKVGLAHRVDHRPDELSGGEQQRVAIARALANGPALVLADEPTGDLDSQSAVEFMKMVGEFNRRAHQTFILVTHDPLVVRECTKAYTIRDGKIERELSRKEIEETVPQKDLLKPL